VSNAPVVTRIGDGAYRVEHEGRGHIVYVAGPAGSQWLHWNGQTFYRPFAAEAPAGRVRSSSDAHQSLTAPMPATVLEVMVEAGAVVRKGDTLLILEAMKMELPIRAAADAVVRVVHCRAGELVQPEALLVELE
jgi:biotin carboxyl carrier protein